MEEGEPLMDTVKIEKLQYLQIGVENENESLVVPIDMTSWVEELRERYSDVGFHVLFKPYNAAEAFPASSEFDDATNILTWTVTADCTAVEGIGYTEIRALNIPENPSNTDEVTLLRKSRIVPTLVDRSVTGIEGGSIPASRSDWVNLILSYRDAAETYKNAANQSRADADYAKAQSMIAGKSSQATYVNANGTVQTLTATNTNWTKADGTALTIPDNSLGHATAANAEAQIAHGYANDASRSADSATGAKNSAIDASGAANRNRALADEAKAKASVAGIYATASWEDEDGNTQTEMAGNSSWRLADGTTATVSNNAYGMGRLANLEAEVSGHFAEDALQKKVAADRIRAVAETLAYADSAEYTNVNGVTEQVNVLHTNWQKADGNTIVDLPKNASGYATAANAEATLAKGYAETAGGIKNDTQQIKEDTEAIKEETAGLLSGKADILDTVLRTTLSGGRKAGTTAGGKSIAFGYNVEASGVYSQAFGQETKASGSCSLAQGGYTVAAGYQSHAEGWRTIAHGMAQHVSGKYNAEDSASSESADPTYAVIVGNGINDSRRSNAYALDWNGNARFNGNVYVGCNADSSGGSKLMSEADLMTTAAMTTMLDNIFGGAA